MKKIIISLLIFLFPALLFAGGAHFDSKWIDDGTNLYPKASGRGVSMGLASTSVSSNTTITVTQVTGGLIVLTGDGTTVTMPAVSSATVGKFQSFYVGDATAKHIDSNASDKFTLNGTALDDGDKLSIGASNAGAIITLYCIDTNGWVAPKGTDGAWVDGG